MRQRREPERLDRFHASERSRGMAEAAIDLQVGSEPYEIAHRPNMFRGHVGAYSCSERTENRLRIYRLPRILGMPSAQAG